jgi:hypothetical protein
VLSRDSGQPPSSRSVTHTELVVRRIRRRVLPRSALGDVVLGFFTTLPTNEASLQWCFSTTEGRRWVTVPVIYWPADGMDQVLAALDRRPRWGTWKDRRLTPFGYRHLVGFSLRFGAVLIVVIAGGIVAYEVWQGRDQDRAVAAVQGEWHAYAAADLQPAGDLVDVTGDVTADDDHDAARLDVSLRHVLRGAEIDLATGGGPVGARVWVPQRHGP